MENQSDKTLDATPFKLDEARKKGNVGKSQEFVSIASIIVMLAIFVVLLPMFAENLTSALVLWLASANQIAQSEEILLSFIGDFSIKAGFVVIVMVAAGAIATIVVSLVHVGPVFSFYPLKLDFSKINPVNGLKRIFSKRGLFEILKVSLKLAFIGVAISFLWGQIQGLVLYQNSTSIKNLAGNWKSALVITVSTFAAIFLIFALVDLWFSKRDFARKMRMSSRDLKDEYKKREGNPDIKSKRKKSMQALLKNTMSLSNIKGADVIVINPTHYAIALQFRAKKMPLPKIVTKGRGVLAKIIIQKAKQHGIPVLRVPRLARNLYKESAINSYIPVAEQSCVAEIYRGLIKRPGSQVFT